MAFREFAGLRIYLIKSKICLVGGEKNLAFLLRKSVLFLKALKLPSRPLFLRVKFFNILFIEAKVYDIYKYGPSATGR